MTIFQYAIDAQIYENSRVSSLCKLGMSLFCNLRTFYQIYNSLIFWTFSKILTGIKPFFTKKRCIFVVQK